jgi:hypothetical protein
MLGTIIAKAYKYQINKDCTSQYYSHMYINKYSERSKRKTQNHQIVFVKNDIVTSSSTPV